MPRAGLWIYDVQRDRATKVLPGKIGLVDWSGDERKLAFTVDAPISEIWAADVASLGSGKTLAEHDRDMIDVYTRRIACESTYTTDSQMRLAILRRAGKSLLSNSKPVLYLADGHVDVCARPRTKSKAVQIMLQQMAEQVDSRPLHVAILHADAPEEAQTLRQTIAQRFECAELYVTELTPVMGAHTGPGVLGVAFYAE